jgi:hypothetical protein
MDNGADTDDAMRVVLRSVLLLLVLATAAAGANAKCRQARYPEATAGWHAHETLGFISSPWTLGVAVRSYSYILPASDAPSIQ